MLLLLPLELEGNVLLHYSQPVAHLSLLLLPLHLVVLLEVLDILRVGEVLELGVLVMVPGIPS